MSESPVQEKNKEAAPSTGKFLLGAMVVVFGLLLFVWAVKARVEQGAKFVKDMHRIMTDDERPAPGYQPQPGSGRDRRHGDGVSFGGRTDDDRDAEIEKYKKEIKRQEWINQNLDKEAERQRVNRDIERENQRLRYVSKRDEAENEFRFYTNLGKHDLAKEAAARMREYDRKVAEYSK